MFSYISFTFSLFRAHSRNSLYIYVVLQLQVLHNKVHCFVTEQIKKEWEEEYYLFIDFLLFYILLAPVNKEVRIHKKTTTWTMQNELSQLCVL